MPQGNLQNLLGAARDFRNFQQEPKQIQMANKGNQLSMRAKEMAVKLQEAGVDNELRAMKEKGDLQTLYKWQALPPEQKPEFLRQEMLRRQTMGEDVSQFSKIINLPLPVQEDLVGATIYAAERMGTVVPEGLRASSSAPSSVQEYQFVQSLTPEEKKVFMDIKRATPAAKASEFGGQKGVLFPDGTFKPITTTKQEAQAGAEIAAAKTEATEQTKLDVERDATAPQRAEKARQIVNNIDNVVLASWGLQNRMDQLRASLTFSPNASRTRTAGPTPEYVNITARKGRRRVPPLPPKKRMYDSRLDGERSIMVSTVSGWIVSGV